LKKTIKPRKLVILNQASNYLTIGFANAFQKKIDEVVLISGSIHVQGEELDPNIRWEKINQWHESPSKKKFLSYLKALIKMWWLLITKYRGYEVFFVSVPPMGYLLNLLLPHRFSMVIWDIYPDVFKITGMKESHFIYRLWSRLNRKSFKKAYKIFTIGDVMASLLENYVSRDKILIQPIWAIFNSNEKIPKAKNVFIKKHQLENKFIVQYSGNIGLTHNVEVLVEIAELLQNNQNILFQIIGRGPRKQHLKKLVEEKNLPNCMFLPFQSDDMFPYSISAADIGVVILDETTSKGSVPSKSYNLMSLGIPSLYIASPDSQLSVYADKFRHAKFFTKSNLKEAAQWLEDMSNDSEKLNSYSNNSKKSSAFFTRQNADKFVQKYLV
jgi:glycosyltransferase involved in cell wall biosynthesis